METENESENDLDCDTDIDVGIGGAGRDGRKPETANTTTGESWGSDTVLSESPLLTIRGAA